VWRECPRGAWQAIVVPSVFSCLFSAHFAGDADPATSVGRHHLREVMHDPVDIRRRIDRLVARVNRRDDYGQLLASGQVVHSRDEVGDVDAWRAEIRRQARADKLKIRTGFNDGLVWALRLRPDPSTHVREVHGYRDLLAQTVPTAVELGHEPTLTLWDGDEVLCTCDRCSARGYGDVVDDVVGGALFEDECPNEAPPKITALTMTYVPRSRRPSDNPGGRIGT
jgi:hypothetical protein